MTTTPEAIASFITMTEQRLARVEETHLHPAVLIYRTNNGWILTNTESGISDVYQFEDERSRAAVFEALLWGLIEIMDVGGTRYDKERVRVSLEPGDKYEAPK